MENKEIARLLWETADLMEIAAEDSFRIRSYRNGDEVVQILVEIPKKLTERQKHLFDLRSQAVTEKLEDPSQIAKTRKDIARVKTILRQRELESQKKVETAKK